MDRSRIRAAAAVALVSLSLCAAPARAQTESRNLAPGFTTRATASRLVIIPADMELFSLSAGGVPEPRADWTEAAQKHFRTALKALPAVMDKDTLEMQDGELDELGQLNALHGAVAEAVVAHHMLSRPALPTKRGVLDWTLGEAVKPLREKTQADYALFFWIRDSYASSERKAAMVAMTLLGAAFGMAIIPAGGQQIGYASLVDLKTGRIVWFNTLARASGDLREEKPAQETAEALLTSFPAVQ